MHPKDKVSSSRNIRILSKEKINSKSLSREPRLQEYPRDIRQPLKSEEKKNYK